MKLEILCYPDERLHKKALPVEKVDAQTCQLVDDMLETMYAAEGIGLAATQVGVLKRIIVIDVSQTRDQPLALINPKIIKEGTQRVMHEEGCLSVPDIYDEVERWDRVTVEALNREGNTFTIESDGLLGRCLQHEIDHLDGHVFVDYLSTLKRNRIRTKMIKKMRENHKKS